MKIYVVDDDRDVATTLQTMLGRIGHDVTWFSNAEAFLAVAGDLAPGCVLLDLCLPKMDGLALQRELAVHDPRHAIVLLSGYGDIPDAVSAMRAGALDFLRKPYRRSDLLDALDRAQVRIEECRERQQRLQKNDRLDLLSTREREVLSILRTGSSTKHVARALGLSARTIDMHRANIIRKLGVVNIVSAIMMATEAGILAPAAPPAA